MRLIDAQIHIWAASRPDRLWPNDRAAHVHGPVSITAEEVLAAMDAAGVTGAVLIPPSFEGDRNDLVLDAVNRFPDRFRAMARFALNRPEARSQVAALAGAWQFLGTRIAFAGPMRGWLIDGTLDWFWPLAQEIGICVSVYPFGQLEALKPVLRAYPRLKFSLDHLGLGLDVQDASIYPVVDQVVHLARYPNLTVKASCLPSYVTEPYPFPTLQIVLRRILAAYGPDRVFWGSDLTRLPCPYAELIRFFQDALAALPQRDIERVMGNAAMEWYGWNPPPGAADTGTSC